MIGRLMVTALLSPISPTQSANLPDTGVKKCPLPHALTHFITHYLGLAARSAPVHGVRF